MKMKLKFATMIMVLGIGFIIGGPAMQANANVDACQVSIGSCFHKEKNCWLWGGVKCTGQGSDCMQTSCH